jgi:serine protease Do
MSMTELPMLVIFKRKIMLKLKKNFIIACIMLFASNVFATSSPTDNNVPPIANQNAYINIYKNAIDSVVTIIVVAENSVFKDLLNNLPKDSPFNKLFEDDGEDIAPKMYGSGSGFIVSADGMVYTNHHVISEKEATMVVTQIHILWKNGESRQAELIASDEVADFAILQIIKDEETPNETFEYVKLADSDKVLPGQMVAAIGSPLDQSFSITSGIVSAINRESRKGRWVTYIQTDTVINKGNSGGPLFDLNGDVIGMNTMLVSPSGYYIGIGYAVPSNLMKEVASVLLTEGKYIRPWMGASLSVPTEAFKLKMDIPVDKLIVILMKISRDGPSYEAGLQKYDVIMSVNGEEMEPNTFIEFLQSSTPGDVVKLQIRRPLDYDEGTYEDLEVDLIVGNMPAKLE